MRVRGAKKDVFHVDGGRDEDILCRSLLFNICVDHTLHFHGPQCLEPTVDVLPIQACDAARNRRSTRRKCLRADWATRPAKTTSCLARLSTLGSSRPQQTDRPLLLCPEQIDQAAWRFRYHLASVSRIVIRARELYYIVTHSVVQESRESQLWRPLQGLQEQTSAKLITPTLVLREGDSTSQQRIKCRGY